MSARKVLLGLFLALSVYLALFADKSPSNSVVEPMQKTLPATPVKVSKQQISIVIDELITRERLISSVKYGGDNQDNKKKLVMFDAQNWNPPPLIVKAPIAAPISTPVAPPLPFQFIGKKLEDGIYEIYLASGDKVHAVTLKTVIDNLYRVDTIKPPTMTITYLPLNQAQTLVIGSTE